MKHNVYFHPVLGRRIKVVELYKSGFSPAQIKEKLNIPVSVRSIQRYIKKLGIARPLSDARALCEERRVESIRRYWDGRRVRRESLRSLRCPPSMRMRVFQRDGFQCQLCGATAKTDSLTVDRIVPHSEGGRYTLENTRTLCFTCNVGRNEVDYSNRGKKEGP